MAIKTGFNVYTLIEVSTSVQLYTSQDTSNEISPQPAKIVRGELCLCVCLSITSNQSLTVVLKGVSIHVHCQVGLRTKSLKHRRADLMYKYMVKLL